MSNKPVLITGAATPLGHEVTRTLLAAGREVVALINKNDTESLTAVELEAQGARYALAVGHGRAAVVGRGGDGVDAQFADPAMSGRHCEIVDGGTAVMVCDLNSMNGTLVDGAAAPRALRVGSVVEAGDDPPRRSHRTGARPRRSGAPATAPWWSRNSRPRAGCVCAVDCAPPLEAPAAERQRTLAVRAAVGGGPIAAASSSAVYDGARACHGRRPLIETDFLPRAAAAPATPWAASRARALGRPRGRGAPVRRVRRRSQLAARRQPAPLRRWSRSRAACSGGRRAYEGDASHVSEAATCALRGARRGRDG